MKKAGAVFLVGLLVLSISIAIAQTNNSNSSTTTNTNSQSTSSNDKIQNGFKCLEEKATSCSGLSVQETALTILASPSDPVFKDCVNTLKNQMNAGSNWGNVKDTALAILALNHAGENTLSSEEWLLSQKRTPTDLVWYIEQDSNTATQCNIGYDANDYTIYVDEGKKIDKNAGPCLKKSQSSFWLEIESSCYDKDFIIECDRDFIIALLYKNRNSPTIYVLEGTKSSPQYSDVKISVNSKCFGSSSCDYEATLWAAMALVEKGYDIEEYLPYIIALSETHPQYLPEAFIYALTNYDDYASKLVSKVNLGNYWTAQKTAYNKFYDTSLALISLGGSSSEQVRKSRDWLLFSQGQNGCWQNSVRETAVVLWALEGRPGRSGQGTLSSVTRCSEANFFCIPTSECPSADVRGNYFCSSLSTACCATENLKSCSQLNGQVCSSGEFCTGNERKALDAERCCLAECAALIPQETECELNYYTCVPNSCSSNQKSVEGYACNQGAVCCTNITSPSPKPSSSWWIWVLLILILITGGIILWVKRKKIKDWWNMRKAKSGSQGQGQAGISPRMPPRGPPGTSIPPRMQRPPLPRGTISQTRTPRPVSFPPNRTYDRRDPEMSDTFKKLRELSDNK